MKTLRDWINIVESTTQVGDPPSGTPPETSNTSAPPPPGTANPPSKLAQTGYKIGKTAGKFIGGYNVAKQLLQNPQGITGQKQKDIEDLEKAIHDAEQKIKDIKTQQQQAPAQPTPNPNRPF